MNTWWNVYLHRYNWVPNEMFIIMIIFVKLSRLIDSNIHINIVHYSCNLIWISHQDIYVYVHRRKLIICTKYFVGVTVRTHENEADLYNGRHWTISVYKTPTIQLYSLSSIWNLMKCFHVESSAAFDIILHVPIYQLILKSMASI